MPMRLPVGQLELTRPTLIGWSYWLIWKSFGMSG